MIENTDGIVKGTLLEFKNNIADLNVVLVQAFHYLSKLRNRGGISIPSKIVLVDISKDHAYIMMQYDTVLKLKLIIFIVLPKMSRKLH